MSFVLTRAEISAPWKPSILKVKSNYMCVQLKRLCMQSKLIVFYFHQLFIAYISLVHCRSVCRRLTISVFQGKRGRSGNTSHCFNYLALGLFNISQLVVFVLVLKVKSFCIQISLNSAFYFLVLESQFRGWSSFNLGTKVGTITRLLIDILETNTSALASFYYCLFSGAFTSLDFGTDVETR